MPYTYEKTDDGYDVLKDGAKVGHVEGDKDDLNKYLAALHANEDKELSLDAIRNQIWDKMKNLINPEGGEYKPFHVEEVFTDYFILCIENKFYKANYTVVNDTVEISDVAPVIRTYVPTVEKTNFWNALKEFFGKKEEEKKTGFNIIKKENGERRWISISSTAHRDREGEIISTKALENDVERTDNSKEYGYLNYWHVPELRIGECDFRMLHDRMLIESGTIYNDKVADLLATKAHKTSIEFYHPIDEPDESGVYNTVVISERAILPSGKEANPFTFANIVGAKEMTREEKIKQFTAFLDNDEELVNEILSNAEARQKEADLVAEFKEKKMEDEEKPEEPKDEEEKPEKDEEEEEEEKKELSVEEITESLVTVIKEQVADAMKEYIEQDKAKFDESMKEVKESLDVVSSKLKTMEEDTPEIANGYIASESKENVIDEDNEILESKTKERNVNPVASLCENLKLFQD